MIRRFIPSIIGLLCIAFAILGALLWFSFRMYVPPNKCAVMIRKSGAALPAGQLVATEPGQRGIQEDVLGPGRYFFNPITWDYEVHPLTVIPSGDPASWEWISSLGASAVERLKKGDLALQGQFPQIGVVTRKVGKTPRPEQVVVSWSSGVQGIVEEVLTPGSYKINPYVFDVQIKPAVVIPAGFVGVVTNLFGTQADAMSHLDTEFISITDRQEGQAAKAEEFVHAVRPLAQPGQRGTLADVLQPGIYFINPKLQKITLVEIGFNEYSQLKSAKGDERLSFPSDTGFLIQVEVTVIWGIHPKHAAQIINEFGNIDGVLEKIIGPQLRSIGRNIGSTYAARDFIEGEKRELFQKALTAELQRVCRAKNIEVLIALVREIEVHPPTAETRGGETTEDLKRTIQQTYIANESRITKDKQREAAAVRAKLEEERKKVEIARETIKAQTRVVVAGILAEGDKKAAEIDAQAQVEVASFMQEAAALEAKRTEILGRADADVEKFKKEAEAKGYQMLVQAFGGGEAYNLYTFAENFKPESIQVFYAGEGTFWTDLNRLQDIAAVKLLERTSSTDSSTKQRE